MNLFNISHYKKVREERLKSGLPVANTAPIEVDYIGLKVMDIETYETFSVKDARQAWMDGWCIVVELEDYDGNTINVIWDNISSRIETEHLMMLKFQFLYN